MKISQQIHNRVTLFAAGFVLGAAFMASPALGLTLAIAAAAYVMWSSLR